MSLPTLRQLQYLVAVIELKHFGHAAEQCFVTQSTLSAGIQDLESLLGITLLERTNRKVLPTSIGLEIAKQAQNILSLSTDLLDIAQSEKSPLSGRIRIGLIPTISPFLLPKVLPTMRTQLPELELNLVEDQSEYLLDQLEAGKIDLAVLALPFNLRGFKYKVFAQEQFWLALPKAHCLNKQKTISIEQLPSDELLLLKEGHCLREHALSACNLPASLQRTSVQGTSLYTLIEMVAGGSGITLVPEIALNSEMINHADICIRPLEKSPSNKPMRELGLVWRTSYRRHQTIALLEKILRDTFA
jgi:LysR family transcriptional regulator, hydrogen peroxide-inducible genes activator